MHLHRLNIKLHSFNSISFIKKVLKLILSVVDGVFDYNVLSITVKGHWPLCGGFDDKGCVSSQGINGTVEG